MSIEFREVQSILKAMAGTPLDYQHEPHDGMYCAYCGYETLETPRIEDRDIPHDAGCPIVMAQHILKAHGMPLCVYRIDFETLMTVMGAPIDEWRPFTRYEAAFSEEEARDFYTENTDM